MESKTYSTLLNLQDKHRSEGFKSGNFEKRLLTRNHSRRLPWDKRYESYIMNSGFYGVYRIGHINVDHQLITALVERWRQETHSFVLPVGEMTITLQDVAVLLGLPVDGEALCQRTDRDWAAVVKNLLGRPVEKTTFRHHSKVQIKISWLQKHFSHCPPNADKLTVMRHARAYLLTLIGSILFTDHSGDSVSAIYLPLLKDFEKAGKYSWASGVLAFLYRELCLATKTTRKQIGGALILLQLWSWERFPMGRPTRQITVRSQAVFEDVNKRPPLGFKWSRFHYFPDNEEILKEYRRTIDNLNDSMVNWQPYEGQMDLLPPVCKANSELWTAQAPLIHFWIVEMHNPHRVLCQFNICQAIPPQMYDTDEDLHAEKNGYGENWPQVNSTYLQTWSQRQCFCSCQKIPYDPSTHNDYMRWFSEAFGLQLLQLPNRGTRIRLAHCDEASPRSSRSNGAKRMRLK